MLGGEFVVVEDLLEQARRGRHTLHLELLERAAHACHGSGAIGGGDHELAHHGIELRGDGVAFHHAGIDADARAGRPCELGQRAGARRQVLGRILAGQTQLEAVSAQRMFHGQLAAVGDGDLLADQVEAADLLADGVLHLQSGVDFQEVDLALFGHHELAGAETHVIDRVEQTTRVGFQLFEHAIGQERSRRLLDELLVAALHGAVAGGVHSEVAVRIAAALRFDMTALVDESFDEILVQIAALQRVMVHVEAAQLVIVVHERDAAAATAIGALEHQRIAVRVREIEQQTHIGNRMGDAGNRRNLGKGGHATGRDLVAQVDERLRIRPDPCGAGIDNLLREGGDFGEETISGMHGVGAAATQDVDKQILVEVRVLVGVAGQQIRVVGHPHILRVTVLFGVDRDRGNPHLTGGAHDAKRDFAAVRHQ